MGINWQLSSSPPNETGVIIPALLTVGQHINTGPLLGRHRQSHRIISGPVKFFGRHTAFEMIVEGPRNSQGGRGQLSDAHDRQRGQCSEPEPAAAGGRESRPRQ